MYDVEILILKFFFLLEVLRTICFIIHIEIGLGAGDKNN